MKVLIAIFVAVVALAVAEYHGNGQPGCKTNEELDTQLFRNTWDPTAYWKCNELNAPAELVRCPDSTGFLESSKSCVNWTEWKWTPPVPPPSEVLEAISALSAEVEPQSVFAEVEPQSASAEVEPQSASAEVESQSVSAEGSVEEAQ